MEQEKTKNVTDWHSLSGKIGFTMSNDYLFRATMQEDNEILKYLTACLLGWDISDITSVKVENPIELGKSIREKDFVMDVRAILNGNIVINLEMQVVNEHNWPERSLMYLCRNFDRLQKGEDYSDAYPAYQISITNFQVFADREDFYSTYMLLDIKNHKKYTDKFRLSVLDLTHIENATEEDKKYKLDEWARLYRAKTWEELNELVAQNPMLERVVSQMYVFSEEDRIREQMEAREDYYRNERTNQVLIARYKGESEEKDRVIAEKDAEIAEKDAELAEKDAIIEKLMKETEKNKAQG